jgi:hypothetical protein
VLSLIVGVGVGVGGGSVLGSLFLLDQLIAGSDADTVACK